VFLFRVLKKLQCIYKRLDCHFSNTIRLSPNNHIDMNMDALTRARVVAFGVRLMQERSRTLASAPKYSMLARTPFDYQKSPPFTEEELDSEIWKHIDEYPGYKISNLGRFFAKKRETERRKAR